MTHFPIALLLFSTACDFVSFTFKKLPFARGLRLVSFYGLAVAALASLGAVVSGIALTKGDLWGRGDLGWHHRIVWPAFGLLMGLAVWRLVVRDAMSRTGLCLYLILMVVASGFVAAAGYFGGRNTPQRGRCTVMIPLEIKGAMAAVITSAFILVATFTAGGIYRNHSGRETELGNKPLAAEDLAVKGRSFFLRSCAQCHGRDADGGEEAPSLLKLQISGAHMTLVIQSGIKGETPSFSKKYNAQDTVVHNRSLARGSRLRPGIREVNYVETAHSLATIDSPLA